VNKRHTSDVLTWETTAFSVILRKIFLQGYRSDFSMKLPKKAKLNLSQPSDDLAALINALSKADNETKQNSIIEHIVLILEKTQMTASSSVILSSSASNAELAYCLKRLVKGSASLKEGTRVAFCAALFAVCSKFSRSYPLPEMYSLISSLLTSSNLYGSASPSNSEEVAVLSAKLGCLGVLLRVYNEDFGVLGEEQSSQIIKELFEISQARSYFAISAFQLLILLENCPGFTAVILDQLQKSKLTANMIWFLHQSSKLDWESMPAHFRDKLVEVNLLNNFELIFNLLVESLSYLSEPHPLWYKFIDHSLRCSGGEKLLSKFDGTILTADSVQWKIIGIQLLSYCFESSENPNIEALPNLLILIDKVSPNLTRGPKASLPLNNQVFKLVHIFPCFLFNNNNSFKDRC